MLEFCFFPVSWNFINPKDTTFSITVIFVHKTSAKSYTLRISWSTPFSRLSISLMSDVMSLMERNSTGL